jgi:hypothetical protein
MSRYITYHLFRAVLGHFLFVFIHPYVDGNGRMARFLMNTMFTTGGSPWTVIRLEHRTQYMRSLEQASVERNIRKGCHRQRRCLMKSRMGCVGSYCLHLACGTNPEGARECPSQQPLRVYTSDTFMNHDWEGTRRCRRIGIR